jgi:hypothetical protein
MEAWIEKHQIMCEVFTGWALLVTIMLVISYLFFSGVARNNGEK